MTPGPMELLVGYVTTKHEILLEALWVQCRLVLFAGSFTALAGVIVGAWMTRRPRMARVVLKVAGTLYTIPILATFVLLIPLVGIGEKTAVIALVIHGILPVLQNTYAGIRDVDPAARDVARGMGATDTQLLFWVEFPLALPKIIAGLRTMLVMSVSVSTFAVFVGAGGLGTIIMQGLRTFHEGMLLAGTLLTALLAMTVELTMQWVEKRATR